MEIKTRGQRELLFLRKTKSKQAAELVSKLREQGTRLNALEESHSGMHSELALQLEATEGQALRAKGEAESLHAR